MGKAVWPPDGAALTSSVTTHYSVTLGKHYFLRKAWVMVASSCCCSEDNRASFTGDFACWLLP